MMTNKHTDGQMAGFTLGREEDAARAARIELERRGETARQFDRSMQRGERVVKIRCGADIKPAAHHLAVAWLGAGWKADHFGRRRRYRQDYPCAGAGRRHHDGRPVPRW